MKIVLSCSESATHDDGRRLSQGKGTRRRKKSDIGRRICIPVQICNFDIREDANYYTTGVFLARSMFRHTEADGHASKKSKKSGGKASVALLKKSFRFGCVSRDTEVHSAEN